MTDTTATAEHGRGRAPRTVAFLRPAPRNHYRVPRPAVISFSGGRTSGYLLRHVIDAYGGQLPDGLFVAFALSRSRDKENYIWLPVMSGNRRDEAVIA